MVETLSNFSQSSTTGVTKVVPFEGGGGRVLFRIGFRTGQAGQLPRALHNHISCQL